MFTEHEIMLDGSKGFLSACLFYNTLFKLSYNLAISLLSICTKETTSIFQRDSYTPESLHHYQDMEITCASLTDEWIKNIVAYTGILFSLNNKQILLFVKTWIYVRIFY